MAIRSCLLVLALCLGFGLPTASAAPSDVKVGDLRAIYQRKGMALRKEASDLAGATTTLPYGTQVKVLELKKPWIRVQTTDGKASGWLKTWQTVEPKALGKNPGPAHLRVTERGSQSSRDVSAAGRQLDADTEKGYRSSRQDLAAAYRAVDAMEAATQALHPGDALEFIDQGNLGRSGRDYGRPARIVPSQRRANAGKGGRRRGRGVGGLLGRGVGEAAKRLGAGSDVARAAESIVGAATALVDQVKVSFTPEQEYFLGRAVAAQAIARYGIDPDENRRRYVRLVGEAVVRLTNRLPANVGGYHFEVLDSDEVNGVSGPGGFVLITRGAVKACRSEAELAGVLAHELAHIRFKDGEAVVRKSDQFPGFIKGLAGAAAGAAGATGDFGKGLVRFFGQVAQNVGTTAMGHGYGRALEFRADKEGSYIAFDVFYRPDGLRNLLSRMDHDHAHKGGSATHGSPEQRVAALDKILAPLKFKAPPKLLAPRQVRFDKTLGR